MKLILLAATLLIASNSYAEINKNNYVYTNDSDEIINAKEELMIAKNSARKTAIRNFQNGWRSGKLTASKSEVVYKVGDKDKVDIGAKIGMTKEQVLNKTYWGKPDNINFATDNYGKFEEWSYDYYGNLIFDNNNLIFIFR
jgi:hypothetical protein